MIIEHMMTRVFTACAAAAGYHSSWHEGTRSVGTTVRGGPINSRHVGTVTTVDRSWK